MDNPSSFEVRTRGRGIFDITREIRSRVEGAGVRAGLCNVFVHHTSASVILCENADPDVRRDLEAYFARAVKDGDPLFAHDAEGPDDMPAHIRSVLTGSSLNVPVVDGTLALGTWQGIFLYEHRTSPHPRKVTVTVLATASAQTKA